MGIPILNYASPLHTFSTGNLSYTTTKECYLFGNTWTNGTSNVTVTIDGLVIHNDQAKNDYPFAMLRLATGTTVTVNAAMPSLFILEEIA